MFPSKLGTSSLGSFTPFKSEGDDTVSVPFDNFLILREQLHEYQLVKLGVSGEEFIMLFQVKRQKTFMNSLEFCFEFS